MLTAALNGGLAGLLATVPMTAAMKLLHRQLPVHEQAPLPPRTITMRLAQRANVDQHLNRQGRKAATIVSHFSYGTAVGSLFGVVCGSNRNSGVGHGVLFGVVVWAVSYLGLLPGLGLLSPATRHPPRRTALMIVAHVVWGAVLALLTPRLQTGRPDS